MNEIETYIQQFPDNVQEILMNIRKLIKENTPNAEERITYGIPAYKNHIGFYDTFSTY